MLKLIVAIVQEIAERLAALDDHIRARGSIAARSRTTLCVAIHDSSTNGGTMFAIAMNDRQFAEGTLTPSVVDQDGQPIVGADGINPILPSDVGIAWSTSDGAVADISETVDGAQAFKIKSGVVGNATVTALLSYPDNSTKTVELGVLIGNSPAGDATVDVAIKDEE